MKKWIIFVLEIAILLLILGVGICNAVYNCKFCVRRHASIRTDDTIQSEK